MYTHMCVCGCSRRPFCDWHRITHVVRGGGQADERQVAPQRDTGPHEHWVVWPRALVSLFTVKGFTPAPVCIRNGALASRCGGVFKEFAGVLASLHSRSRSLFRPPLPQRKQAAAVLPRLLHRALGSGCGTRAGSRLCPRGGLAPGEVLAAPLSGWPRPRHRFLLARWPGLGPGLAGGTGQTRTSIRTPCSEAACERWPVGGAIQGAQTWGASLGPLAVAKPLGGKVNVPFTPTSA